MSFEQYYQDEIAYLREMGEAFSDAYPKLAPFLAQKGNDPDVERLLEGVAFISGKIRQKLDDEFPELTHNLHALLWPQLLRPVPALSILEFNPIANALTEATVVKKGIEIDSVPVDGTACRFRTCYDVELYPLSIVSVERKDYGSYSSIKLRFQSDSGEPVARLNLDKLRLFLFGDMQSSFSIYQHLFRYLNKVVVSSDEASGQTFELDASAVSPFGFDDDEALLSYPDNAFSGYRLLQEYFSLPHKFLFFNLQGLEAVSTFSESEYFDIEFVFDRCLDEFVRVNDRSLLLNCTPIINLFSMDADPVRTKQGMAEYRVRPASPEQTHFETYSIDDVIGYAYGGRERIEFLPFVSFDNSIDSANRAENYYQLRVKPSVIGSGADTYVSFISPGEMKYELEAITVSMVLTCTNRHLPEKLQVGDVSVATASSPEFATFRNIFPAVPSTPAPIQKDLHWQLISNMSLNFMSFGDIKALRTILSTYNFQSFFNRKAARAHELKMQALVSVDMQPKTLLFRGLPTCGYCIHLSVKSGDFAGEGEMYMFASILNEFLALYTRVNSFSQLIVSDVDKGEEHTWPARIGQKILQ